MLSTIVEESKCRNSVILPLSQQDVYYQNIRNKIGNVSRSYRFCDSVYCPIRQESALLIYIHLGPRISSVGHIHYGTTVMKGGSRHY